MKKLVALHVVWTQRKKLIYKRDDGIGFYKCLQCNIDMLHPDLLKQSY